MHINSLLEEIKEEQNTHFSCELKPIVESIFEVNKRVFTECADRYLKNHLIINAIYNEDLLNPYPMYSIEIDTDDMDFIEERIKLELKPVVINGNLRYEFYNNWKDYANTIKELFYQQYITYLAEAQRDNQEKLDHFTVGQLIAFFESFYGKDHNMSQKLKYYSNAIGLSSEDPKWSDAKRDRRLFKYRVETRISPYNYRIDYKD